MGNQIAAIELRMLVGELRQLEGSWLDQVYDLEAAEAKPGKALVFQFNKSEGKRFLVCLAPSAVFFSAAKPATSEKQSGFCSFLRHHLGNAKLVSISQFSSERILELVFSSRQQLRFRLVIELFSKGNVILVDEKGVILGCAESQAWKDRTVRPGFKYALPPATADFATMDEGQFQKAVLSSEKDSVVKALAVDLGLSGVYAEGLCLAAAVAKDKSPSQLSEQDLSSLYSALQQLLSRKQPVNAALEASAIAQLETASLSSKTAALSGHMKELEIAIGQQKAAVKNLAAAAKEATAAAEAIYLHYQEIKQVLDDYNRLRKTFTPEQLREYFSSNKKVVSIDEKTGQVTLEIQ